MWCAVSVLVCVAYIKDATDTELGALEAGCSVSPYLCIRLQSSRLSLLTRAVAEPKKGFFKMRRSIACMLLMVVLSNARNQPIPNSSSGDSVDSECSISSLQSQLTSVQNQLTRMQGIVSTLNDPLIKGNCTIDLAAYGYDDSAKYGYIRTSGGSSEQIYFPEQIDRYRGVILVELDANTCKTQNRQNFDTYIYWLTNATFYKQQFLETLESAASGTIIVGVSADSAQHETAFQNIVGSFFNRYNMNILGLQAREKFVFVMQKGYPKKSVFQKKARYAESLRMKVALSGSTVSDVTFTVTPV